MGASLGVDNYVYHVPLNISLFPDFDNQKAQTFTIFEKRQIAIPAYRKGIPQTKKPPKRLGRLSAIYTTFTGNLN